jgi:hypothetical protein
VAGFWSDIGREQHLVVGQLWSSGYEPMPSTKGAVSYVLSETPPRLRAAATDRGEVLMVWEGALPGSGNTTQIIAQQVEVKE